MKFREQGKKVQVLAYFGYDDEKKQSIQKMIATYHPTTFTVSYVKDEDGTERAKPEMKAELEAHIASLKKGRDEEENKWLFTGTISNLKVVGVELEKGNPAVAEAWDKRISELSKENAESIWRAIMALEKHLDAAGHARPKRAYKKDSAPVSKDPRQIDLIKKV